MYASSGPGAARTAPGLTPGVSLMRPDGITPSSVRRACERCGGEFVARAADVKRGRARFCGHNCASASIAGPKLTDAASRFWPKVDTNGAIPEHRPDLGPCWLWTASLNNHGYGRFKFGSRRDGSSREVSAHVWAYLDAVGPVPPGLELDHLCRVTRCVRPSHLEPVTHRENTLRSEAPSALSARKTHCPQGHPYSGDNLHLRPDGSRRCRICVDAQNKGRYS